MKHFGDITTLNGAEIPAVDLATGGSPCQDLSVAGKRAGLAGERSGLFMEQIRLIKEMRQHERDIGRSGVDVRPRYMVWENVPGAFSSNNGEDFRAVLEETARVADETVSIPRPDKGKWATAGAICGDGWSIELRTMDAQFWGVPQRRRRIALVADFAGDSAGEILFERESLSGDTAESGAAGQGTAADTGQGVEGTSGCLTAWDCQSKRIHSCNGIMPTLQGGVGGGVNNPAIFSPSVKCLNPQDPQSARVYDPSGTAQTPTILDMAHANDVIRDCGGTCPTLQSRMGTGGNQVPLTFQNTGRGWWNEGETAATVRTPCGGDATKANLTYQPIAGTLNPGAHPGSYNGQDAYNDMLIAAVDCRNGRENPDVNGTLQAKEQGQNLNSNNVVRVRKSVRRLTPTECERLQGYPDGWTLIGERTTRVIEVEDEDTGNKYTSEEAVMTYIDADGKKRTCSDSARYKALGNSIALPQWYFVLGGIARHLPPDATLGSLFDGIGGFPLVWSNLHGGNKFLCVWASEIESFPIAVTKHRFPDGSNVQEVIANGGARSSPGNG